MTTKKSSKRPVALSIKELFALQAVWPVIVIDRRSGSVIALQETDESALRRTLRSGR